MLRNYAKIAYRTLLKHKGYTFINVFSLSLGIACCALIFLYVRDAWTHDQFHADGDQIYRLYRVEQRGNGTTKISPTTPLPMAPALQEELPGIELTTRFAGTQATIRKGTTTAQHRITFVDPAFFDIFTFSLQEGTASLEPGTIVLSAEQAARWFGATNPIGQTLDLRFSDTYASFRVTGVAAPLPSTSSIRFDVAASIRDMPDYSLRQDRWTAHSASAYVKLDPSLTTKNLHPALDIFTDKYFGESIVAAQEAGWFVPGDDAFRWHLQPLEDLYLNTTVPSFWEEQGNPMHAYILSGIAFAVLLLGCFNFMTLSIGRASGRAREVGLRKVLGAHRRQLMGQFWGEALLLSLFALAVGLAIAELCLPMFNDFAQRELRFDYLDSGVTLLSVLGIALFCGLTAGSFPALVLSGFQPVVVLTGRLRLTRGFTFSKALVVFQFSVAVILIGGTFVIFEQLSYIEDRNLGFAEEAVVMVPLGGSAASRTDLLERYRAALNQSPHVSSVTGTSYRFTNVGFRTVLREDDKQVITYMVRVEPNYLDLMNIPLQAGRNFDPNMTTDIEQAVLVNEAFVEEFGWSEGVGREVPGYENVHIVGVVSDFHFRSLHHTIEPMVLHMSPSLNAYSSVLIRLNTTATSEALADIQAQWETIAPDVSFTFRFLDDQLHQLYQDERDWAQLVSYASLLAIVIACLGLLGLTSLMVSRRTKEIGVRKVLGASVTGIVGLVSRSFVLMVVLSTTLACPLVYWIAHEWLSSFAYHIAIPWQSLIYASLLAIGIALATVSYQAIRAALADPVKALRYE